MKEFNSQEPHQAESKDQAQARIIAQIMAAEMSPYLPDDFNQLRTKMLPPTSDIRPRVLDNISNKSILIDSGAMVTVRDCINICDSEYCWQDILDIYLEAKVILFI